jgi:hypothetical protein
LSRVLAGVATLRGTHLAPFDKGRTDIRNSGAAVIVRGVRRASATSAASAAKFCGEAERAARGCFDFKGFQALKLKGRASQ